ncbi:MAG: endonuclease MutS2, partial [Duncaniella sp.]|nr:endonuclease MutS2 [Duncaniella sp.]
MIFPEKIEYKIGFNTVREQISRRCRCEGSRLLCAEMAWMDDYKAVRASLEAVAEMADIRHSQEALPLDGIHDINGPLNLIHIPGTFIEIKDLMKVRKMLRCFAEVNSFFANRREGEGSRPSGHLASIAEPLEGVSPALAASIDRAIDEGSGHVKDNASPELAQIRSQLRGMAGRVNSILRRVIASGISAGYLESDTVPSMRDGRLVIPVAPSNKRRIPGIVHDESASGKTVFIEPSEVVEANNLTRELQIEEQREIVKIIISIAD